MSRSLPEDADPVQAQAVVTEHLGLAPGFCAPLLRGRLQGSPMGRIAHLAFLAFSAGCTGTETAPPVVEGELVFVRDGVVSPVAEGEGQALVGGGRLVSRSWTPGEMVQLDGHEGIPPREAECLTLFQVDLGDVARHVAMGAPAPATALSWSPDGERLAVGSYRGEVLVVDGWTGEVQARRRLSETMVKDVSWSADGSTIYAGEQSPDAFLRALDAGTLDDRWTLRLADRVGSSPAPPAEDIYGVYTLPGAYGLEVLDGGDLLVLALHSWTDADSVKRNRSQALRVSPAGEVVAAWPQEPADATFTHPRVDADGGLVVFTVNRSADGEPAGDLPLGGVQVLDLASFEPDFRTVVPGLEPHFTRAFIWEALDVSKAHDAVFMGFGDGRVRAVGLDGTERLGLDVGVPILAGDVPIHASIGWGFLHLDSVVFNTGRTLIPWGAASPDLRPPSAHPAENTVHVVGLDGESRWTWTSEREIQGLTPAPDGRSLVVGAGSRTTDQRRDLYGAVVLDLGGPAERGGKDRQRAVCSTEGPVFFAHAVSEDGRIALSEFPVKEEDDSVSGAYRLTVMR